ncbi:MULTISPECIES: hypothetical protein [unclassified Spirosoma]|uniref:hypothetical protein n=1 Tax=unclassified Spirosoma TaxID=2621999 RepID=UPI00095FCD19|nr:MULTISPECIES: hypothetical protein [unclassified Spirosoma]MBN8822002.1 hypothetical protein [Spirosoma sp.]OJW80414.1 MAG: hypothetical protein BGO59_33550 [Spirosoma sp. 48-14]
MRPYLVLSLILGIGFFVGEHYWHLPWITAEWRVLIAFFLSVSVITSRLHAFGYHRTDRIFAMMPLIATVLRLVLSMLFFGLMLYRGLPDRNLFVITFLVLYLCYLGFEIILSRRNLRRNS